ncbi:MAG: hypothetical protein AAFQ71_11425 [Planctomycetota bacterium]
MIRMKVSNPVLLIDRMERRRERATRRAMFKVGANLRTTASRSIRVRKTAASKPGKPPHTRGNRRLRKSIMFAVDRNGRSVIVGPTKAGVGLAGEAHERGERFRGRNYPRRPYMAPALEVRADDLRDLVIDTIRKGLR